MKDNNITKLLVGKEDISSAELTKQLIETAEKGKHRNFEFITNIDTLSVAKTLRDALEKLVTAFTKTAKMSYNLYVIRLKAGSSPVEFLLQYKTFSHCAKFYKEEYKILTNMIQEYHAYLMYSWHLFDHLLGREREEKDLYDYRILSRRITYSGGEGDSDSTSSTI